VIEKDPHYVGGLARTVEHNGYRFDIGGHRFFSKNQEIEDLWTEVMQDDMLTRGRPLAHLLRGRFYAYPIKAFNALWNLGPIRGGPLPGQLRLRQGPADQESTQPRGLGAQPVRLAAVQHLLQTYTEKCGASAPGICPPTGRHSGSRASPMAGGSERAAAETEAAQPWRDRDHAHRSLPLPEVGPGSDVGAVTSILASRGRPVLMGRTILRIEHRAQRANRRGSKPGRRSRGARGIAVRLEHSDA